MTGPETLQTASARHTAPAAADTELEALTGTDLIDVEVEPMARPLLQFTIAAVLCIAGAVAAIVLATQGLELLRPILTLVGRVAALPFEDTSTIDAGY